MSGFNLSTPSVVVVADYSNDDDRPDANFGKRDKEWRGEYYIIINHLYDHSFLKEGKESLL